MSIIELCHFGSFLQDMIPDVVCVHFLLGWVNLGISMDHRIAFGLVPQNFLVYVRNDLTLCNRDILSTFPGVPLRVRQPIRGFKAVKITPLSLVENFQLVWKALKIMLLPSVRMPIATKFSFLFRQHTKA